MSDEAICSEFVGAPVLLQSGARPLTGLAWLDGIGDHDILTLEIRMCEHRFVALKNRRKGPAVEKRFLSIPLATLGELQIFENQTLVQLFFDFKRPLNGRGVGCPGNSGYQNMLLRK